MVKAFHLCDAAVWNETYMRVHDGVFLQWLRRPLELWETSWLPLAW